jgi:hypothetical protein
MTRWETQSSVKTRQPPSTWRQYACAVAERRSRLCDEWLTPTWFSLTATHTHTHTHRQTHTYTQLSILFSCKSLRTNAPWENKCGASQRLKRTPLLSMFSVNAVSANVFAKSFVSVLGTAARTGLLVDSGWVLHIPTLFC